MFAPLLYIGSTVVNLTGVLNNGYPDYPAFVICLLAFSLLLYEKTILSGVALAISGIILTFMI